jgi:geranylgeranyl pyrophosphate synthase
LLLALALEGLAPSEKAELLGLITAAREHTSPDDTAAADTVARVRGLYQKAQVFTKADALVEKYRARAEALADGVEPAELRELLYYLVDTVLDRPAAPEEEPREFPVELGLPK